VKNIGEGINGDFWKIQNVSTSAAVAPPSVVIKDHDAADTKQLKRPDCIGEYVRRLM
jgi:hypothetical protein